MKAFVCLLLAAVFTSAACAGAFVNVYLPDGTTLLPPSDPNVPSVYQDIMVGTRLDLVVGSDVGGYWYGGLLLTWGDWAVGTLTPRGEESGPPFFTYDDSALEAAGTNPFVQEYGNSSLIGLDLTASPDAVPGEWFVVDYRAEKRGVCHVGLYDYAVSIDTPRDVLTFHHVPSRDFDEDTTVNFLDFALLASQWRHEAGLDPNFPTPADLDGDSFVGAFDLAQFSGYWLERTDCNDATADSNAPGS